MHLKPAVLFLLSACTGPAGSAPTPYVYVPEEVAYEPPEAGVAVAALEVALGRLAGINPEVFSERYLATAEHFDPDGCPSWSDHNGQDRWTDDCVTSSGLEFHGDFLALNESGYYRGDEYIEAFQRNFGQLNARFPTGEHVIILGDTEVDKTRMRDGRSADAAFAHGDFYWNLGEAWLQEFLFVSMTWEGEYAPGGAWSVQLHGELGRLTGEASALAVDSLRLSGDAQGCTSAPTGVLQAWTRDDAQEIRLTLAGDGEGGCVACGPLEIAGQPAGERCVDLSAWQGAAW